MSHIDFLLKSIYTQLRTYGLRGLPSVRDAEVFARPSATRFSRTAGPAPGADRSLEFREFASAGFLRGADVVLVSLGPASSITNLHQPQALLRAPREPLSP